MSQYLNATRKKDTGKEALVAAAQARVFRFDVEAMEWKQQGSGVQYLEITSNPANQMGRVMAGDLTNGNLVMYCELTKKIRVWKQTKVWLQFADTDNVTWGLGLNSVEDADRLAKCLIEISSVIEKWNEYAAELEAKLALERQEREELAKVEAQAQLQEEARLRREEELANQRTISLNVGTNKQTKKAAKEVERLKKLGTIVDEDSELAKEMKKRGVKKGTLMKAGKNVLEKWKSRWFVLEGEYLKYYKDDSERDQLGQINCMTCQVKTFNGGKGAKKYAFEIVTPKKPYKMYGESQENVDEWVDAIRSVATMVMDFDTTSRKKSSSGPSASSASSSSESHLEVQPPAEARAIFPYKRKQEKQLSVHVGDNLEIYFQGETGDEGWWAAVNLETGKSGWIPKEFVEFKN